jgi:hypothetical protein
MQVDNENCAVTQFCHDNRGHGSGVQGCHEIVEFLKKLASHGVGLIRDLKDG